MTIPTAYEKHCKSYNEIEKGDERSGVFIPEENKIYLRKTLK